MPRRAGRVVPALLPIAIATLMLAACAPRPLAYHNPARAYAVSRPAARKPVGLAPCPQRSAALSDTEKAELFRQFEAWQKNGGTGPAPRRQFADAGTNCAPAVP